MKLSTIYSTKIIQYMEKALGPYVVYVPNKIPSSRLGKGKHVCMKLIINSILFGVGLYKIANFSGPWDS